MPGWWPDYWLAYAPLGFIGLVRWGIWLLKKIPAQFYRPLRPLYDPPPVSIITPVYNEDPDGFRNAVLSWIAERPAEIIAVVDASDERCLRIFRDLEESTPAEQTRLVLIVTTVPGKRAALAEGIRAARSQIVALVDSDTLWDKGVLAASTAPFADSGVGGVGTRQNVYEPAHLWQRMADIVLDLRFHDELPCLARTGGYLTCLSGRTAFYRRSVLLPLLPKLVHEEFLGEECISGDDKRLTYLVQAEGYKTSYQSNARVYTFMPADFPTFLKQRVRWSRNTWRADLRALSQRWSWRYPGFVLFLMDRSIAPLTSLIAPAFMTLALISGEWAIAGMLVIWWVFSRGVKIWPHLRNRPQDVFILPLYIPLTYLLAIVKIYALITLNWHGWLTRGLARSGPFQFSRVAMGSIPLLSTGLVVSLVLAGVLTYGALVSAPGGERKKSTPMDDAIIEPAAMPAPLAMGVTQVVDPPIPSLPQTTLSEQEHTVAEGQTIHDVAAAFFGNAGYWRMIASRNNLRPPYALAGGQHLVIPTANLPLPPDSAKVEPASVGYDPATNAIVVSGRETAVRLGEIAAQVPNMLSQPAPGEWLLSAHLVITDRVTLDMRGPDKGGDVGWLKLKSDETGFATLVAADGRILMENTRVTSWDTIRQTFDTNIDDGRAYVLAKNLDSDIADTRMDIIGSELSYLGFDAGESYGVSWRVSKVAPKVATGTVINSRFLYNYFGAYTFGARNMIWRGNEFAYNISYGLDPHDDSNNFLVESNHFHDNGRHGMIISMRCNGNVIRNNVSENNQGHGFMLHMDSNNNLVEGNVARGNNDGFAVLDSKNNVVRNNVSEANRKAAFRVNGTRPEVPAQDNYITDNQMKGNDKGIYVYGVAPRNVLLRNMITDHAGAGIDVRSDGNQIGAADRGNHVERNKSGILLKPGGNNNLLEGNRVLGNRQDGVGLSGVSGNVLRRNWIGGNLGRGVNVEGSPGAVLLLNELTGNDSFNVVFNGSTGGRAAQNLTGGDGTRSYSVVNASGLTLEDEEAYSVVLDSLSSVDLIDRDGNVLNLGHGRFSKSFPEGSMIRIRVNPAPAGPGQLGFSVAPSGIALAHHGGQIQVGDVTRSEKVSWQELGAGITGPVTHVVQGLYGAITYRVEVDGEPMLTTTSSTDGVASFTYEGDYTVPLRFELVPEQPVVRGN
jgi:hyaluronan synthase